MVFDLFFLSLFFFLLLCLFTFLHFFLVLLLLISLSLFILFLFCFCFRPHKPELNPKPRTLHPISDGPLRWTPPPVNPPPPDNPPPDRPKFRSFFFPPPATIFILLSLSWVLSLNFVGVFEGRGPEMCTFGRFKHHQNSTKGPQERERRKKIVAGGGKKSWAPHPSGLHPSGPHFFFGPPFGAPPFEGPTLCRPKIQHPKIGRSRNWPKSRLAEVDRARCRHSGRYPIFALTIYLVDVL